MDKHKKRVELLLKEYNCIQDRFEKNNKLVYRTVYLSIIYGGVVIQPLPSVLLERNIFHLFLLTTPSGLIFFGFSGMIIHFRDRRDYLRDQLRDVEARLVDDYTPVNFHDEPAKKKVDARLLQRLYIVTGVLFLTLPVLTLVWFDVFASMVVWETISFV